MRLGQPGTADGSLQHSHTIKLIIKCCRYERFGEIQDRVVGFRLYVSNSEEAAKKKGEGPDTMKTFFPLQDVLPLNDGIETCFAKVLEPMDQYIEYDDDDCNKITFSPNGRFKYTSPVPAMPATTADDAEIAGWFRGQPATTADDAEIARWFRGQPATTADDAAEIVGWFRGQPTTTADDAEIAGWFRGQPANVSPNESLRAHQSAHDPTRR